MILDQPMKIRDNPTDSFALPDHKREQFESLIMFSMPEKSVRKQFKLTTTTIIRCRPGLKILLVSIAAASSKIAIAAGLP